MAHPNEELARSFYAAFDKGDIDAVKAMTTDDLEMHEPGASPLAGSYRGKEAVFDFFARLGAVTGGTIRIEQVHDVLANDERAIGLFTSSAERNGETIRAEVAEVFEIVDGKIASIKAHVYDQPTWDRALT